MTRQQGRYLCPIDRHVVTLGKTGVQLTEPMTLLWKPGMLGIHHLDEPGEIDAARLARVDGKILGAGCVVSNGYDPHRGRPSVDDRAGLRLVPAGDDSDPGEWIVNDPLLYRSCAACGTRIPDLPERRVPTRWTPKRREVMRGRGRLGRKPVPVIYGPHPAGTLACVPCDPRTTARR